jgi:hypothetical protein
MTEKKGPYQIQKERREKSGRSRVHFELSHKAIALLNKTARETHISRPSLLELMVRQYCEPKDQTEPRRRTESEF